MVATHVGFEDVLVAPMDYTSVFRSDEHDAVAAPLSTPVRIGMPIERSIGHRKGRLSVLPQIEDSKSHTAPGFYLKTTRTGGLNPA